VRRVIVTSTATVSGIVLLIGLKSHPAGTSSGAAKTISSGGDPGPVATSSAPAAGGTGGGSSSSGGSTGGPTAAPTTKAAGGSTGTRVITGTAADTRYGPVQLQVTFSGKKITKIDVIQYPTESGRDQEINQYALPILNQEAIAAQSAQIDAVSGATYSSDGYAQSLQSAIDQAGA
jgi:uncharacterized protein with FMN-binding domain